MTSITEKSTVHHFRLARELAYLLFITAVVLFPFGKVVRLEWSPRGDPDLLTSQGQSELQTVITSAFLSDLRWPNFGRNRADVAEFYRLSNSRLAWLHGNRPTDQARAMIAMLQKADRCGLTVEDYDGGKWSERLAAFDGPGKLSEWNLIRFDVSLTVSTMRYVSDLHAGRVNPRALRFDLGTPPKRIELADFIVQRIVSSDDTKTAIESIEPPFPAYRRTVAALYQYLELSHQQSGQSLPQLKKPVKPGDSYGAVASLVRLLHATGDLPAEMAETGATLTQVLSEAVKKFQQRHGLDPTGFIDIQTSKQLNVPFAERVRQLQLTLERWRWAPQEFDRPPIVVNIPEFRLHTNDVRFHWDLSMKVVVGKAYRHKTPVFAGKLRSVIIRPYWNVPIDIQKRELFPEIAKSPSYLVKHSYEIVDQKGIAMGFADKYLPDLLSGRLRIRQKPGPANALGVIKFEFPNSYDIYMHDTPASQLFSRARRDFSHGCIRVEDPVALAAWVLRDQPGWSAEQIRTAANGEKTIQISLQRPIPVLIVYGTAVVMEDGEIHFFDDIYGYDKTLERALANYQP
jgi:murein L,D-transpeptidase YcbB/YkuD